LTALTAEKIWSFTRLRAESRGTSGRTITVDMNSKDVVAEP
jgi:hypothetical protein